MEDAGQRDAEVLLNELLDMAGKLLGEFGSFHPIGAYLDAEDGALVHVGVQLDERAGASAHLASLESGLRRCVEAKKAKAVGVALDVLLPDTGGVRHDAVELRLEHVKGYRTTVFAKYTIDSSEVTFSALTAQRGTTSFWRAKVH